MWTVPETRDDRARAVANADSAVSRLLPIDAARSSAIAVGRTPREWRSNNGWLSCASSEAMCCDAGGDCRYFTSRTTPIDRAISRKAASKAALSSARKAWSESVAQVRKRLRPFVVGTLRPTVNTSILFDLA